MGNALIMGITVDIKGEKSIVLYYNIFYKFRNEDHECKRSTRKELNPQLNLEHTIDGRNRFADRNVSTVVTRAKIMKHRGHQGPDAILISIHMVFR